jgi:hypothetical protein
VATNPADPDRLAVGVDVERIERAEASLDKFIEARVRERSEQESIEGLWAASDRKDRERRRQDLREAWSLYHDHMSRLHGSLSEEHRTKSEALCDAQRE